jgi:hypothetical protein
MDIETLEKVIDMIDNRLNSTWEEDKLLNYMMNNEEYMMLGRRKALADFRDQLQKYVDKQVAQMETEQGM